MADRALLVRELIAIQDPTPELNLELAEETAGLLGYAKLKKTLAAENVIGELASVLYRLDIQPISRDSVEPFKAEEPDAAELTDVPEFFKTTSEASADFPPADARVGSAVDDWHSRWLADFMATRLSQRLLQYMQRHIFELPSAEFYVEQRAKDPFLIVKCGEEEYYVEVWQESRF